MKLLQDGPGVKWEQQHLELILQLPTIVYDRGGDFDEAVGTDIERRLVELDSAGFIALDRPGEAMIDIKLTACGRALLELLWDHADRMHRRGFYNGDAPLPRAAEIIGDALRGA